MSKLQDNTSELGGSAHRIAGVRQSSQKKLRQSSQEKEIERPSAVAETQWLINQLLKPPPRRGSLTKNPGERNARRTGNSMRRASFATEGSVPVKPAKRSDFAARVHRHSIEEHRTKRTSSSVPAGLAEPEDELAEPEESEKERSLKELFSGAAAEKTAQQEKREEKVQLDRLMERLSSRGLEVSREQAGQALVEEDSAGSDAASASSSSEDDEPAAPAAAPAPAKRRGGVRLLRSAIARAAAGARMARFSAIAPRDPARARESKWGEVRDWSKVNAMWAAVGKSSAQKRTAWIEDQRREEDEAMTVVTEVSSADHALALPYSQQGDHAMYSDDALHAR